jgi:phosphoglycolate phosphatase
MIRNIIFDWSGTLVDDLPAVWQATNYVFRKAGRDELTLDQFRAEFSLPFVHFYQRLLPDLPMEQLELWFHEHFRAVQDMVVPLPHARQFLDWCHARQIRSFVLTSVHPEHWTKQAASAGLTSYFEKAYTGVWDKRAKISEVLAEKGLIPSETLMVGDMQHDIDTAHHGSIHSCAVLTGYNSVAQLRQSNPELIVEHLGELGVWLENRGWEFVPNPQVQPAERLPVCTVGALIFRSDQRVLMIRTLKWSNLWGIPGGKIRYGESSELALLREIKEETNLEVSAVQFTLVQDCIGSTEFYREAHFVLLNYTCLAQNPEQVVLNEEAQEFRWVTPEEALLLNLNQPTRFLLQQVLEQRKNPSK